MPILKLTAGRNWPAHPKKIWFCLNFAAKKEKVAKEILSRQFFKHDEDYKPIAVPPPIIGGST